MRCTELLHSFRNVKLWNREICLNFRALNNFGFNLRFLNDPKMNSKDFKLFIRTRLSSLRLFKDDQTVFEEYWSNLKGKIFVRFKIWWKSQFTLLIYLFQQFDYWTLSLNPFLKPQPIFINIERTLTLRYEPRGSKVREERFTSYTYFRWV